MHFQELERFKSEYPSIKEKILGLDDYLFNERRATPSLSGRDIVPSLLAKKLGIDNGLALTLLYLAEQAGILSHRYVVFCKASDFHIGTFADVSEIPDGLSCDFHSTEHDADEFYVQLVFFFTHTERRAAV